MSEEVKQGLPIVEFADQAALEAWLDEHHDAIRGVWVKFAKKAAPVRTVSYDEAVEVALCYGWIDGQVARYDEHYYLQRLTQRTSKSKWSQINRTKAEALIAAGRMKPAGLAHVEAAKADGRWEAAYAPASEITVPDDLQQALDASPRAAEFFATLTGSRRYAFLYRLHNVKRPENRARRIADYIELLAEGKTLEQR